MEDNLDKLIKDALKNVADNIDIPDSDKLKERIKQEIAHSPAKNSRFPKIYLKR